MFFSKRSTPAPTKHDAGAAELLDRAIAYVEEYGFSAEHYGYAGHPCCHIGLLRQMAGLCCDPLKGSTTDGNPELARALTAMDAVTPRTPRVHGVTIREQPGRVAEAYALSLVRRRRISRDQQAVPALKILRNARRQLVTEQKTETAPQIQVTLAVK